MLFRSSLSALILLSDIISTVQAFGYTINRVPCASMCTAGAVIGYSSPTCYIPSSPYFDYCTITSFSSYSISSFPWIAGSTVTFTFNNSGNTYQPSTPVTVSIEHSPEGTLLASKTGTVANGFVSVLVPSWASGSGYYLRIGTGELIDVYQTATGSIQSSGTANTTTTCQPYVGKTSGSPKMFTPVVSILGLIVAAL